MGPHVPPLGAQGVPAPPPWGAPLDKIFTKWVAIKKISAQFRREMSQNFAAILEGSRPLNLNFKTFSDINI